MKGSAYNVLYVVVLGTVCATLLTAAAVALKPYREANAEADRIRNVLKVLEVPGAADADAEKLVEIYRRDVREQKRNGQKVYVYAPDGAVKAVAVPFAGQGVWGPIEGFLAFDPDFRTLRGLTVHKQEETPGLGGKIASSAFTRQFEDRVLPDDAEAAAITLRRPGAKPGPGVQMEAISGATMTSDRIEGIINDAIRRVRGRTGHGR